MNTLIRAGILTLTLPLANCSLMAEFTRTSEQYNDNGHVAYRVTQPYGMVPYMIAPASGRPMAINRAIQKCADGEYKAIRSEHHDTYSVIDITCDELNGEPVVPYRRESTPESTASEQSKQSYDENSYWGISE